jgi:transcription termination/antitermination protein NusG
MVQPGDDVQLKQIENAEQCNITTESEWFAVATRPRHEKTVDAKLEALGIDHFLPVIEEEHVWSDRRKRVLVPLFAGYLFIRVAMSNTVRVRVGGVPGVIDLVGNQGGPLPISGVEIDSIRTLLNAGRPCSPHPYPEEGQPIIITRGPLEGLQGRFIRVSGKSRIVVTIQTIRRAVSVEVGSDDIRTMQSSLTSSPFECPAWAPAVC